MRAAYYRKDLQVTIGNNYRRVCEEATGKG